MRNDRDNLLRQNVKRIAREARGLDVALVHGAGDGGAGNQVGAIFGKENAFADRIHMMAGAANALHTAGHGGWCFNLNHEVDGAHVDAEFQRGGGAKGANLAGLQLLLNDGALRGGERAVMGAGDVFAGQLIERSGQPLGNLAAVDEKNCRVALADDFEQAGMNCIPDGDPLGSLGSRTAGQILLFAEACHIFNWNFNF